jgi:signal transduction histidine kinase
MLGLCADVSHLERQSAGSLNFMPSLVSRIFEKIPTNPFFKYGLAIAVAMVLVASIFPEVLGGLLRSDQFMPHATCYLRNPKVILLHVTSDLLIGLSYVSISTTLGYLVHKASQDIPFHWMFLAFGLFIITCGFTHFMEVWTVWRAVYWLAGYVKLICAVASVATAIALYPLVPKIFASIRAVQLSEQRRLELQSANLELEAFTYSVSHDLRAPLRAVRGMAQCLSEDYGKQLEPGARHYLERIIGASKSMDALVRDLLEYTRVSRSAFELKAVDLKAALDEAQFLIHEDAKQSQAVIRVEGPMPQVLANHTLLGQVLSNLLGNALKFVAPGTKPMVRILVEAAPRTVRISISDNGIGIAPEFQEKIFRIFERLHSTDDYPGTGIGLAIVHKAMSQMKGEVGLESIQGKGSTFWIQLQKATA